MRKRVIVFAPHPDDETLGCGGTIAKKVKQGYDVFVIYMTDGRYALKEIGITSSPNPFEMKEKRKKDAIKAAKILGLREENMFFLEIKDKTLKKKQDVQNKITRILMDIKPVEIYFPQKKEYNIDHQMTNLIVKAALKESKINAIGYQYAIAWAFPFYLLTHVLNERSFDLLVCGLLKYKLIHTDISKFLPTKIMALAAYKSQLTLLSPEQSRPVLKPSFILRFLKNEEKFFIERTMGKRLY
jgi:LmbE family N-acetylglucosaminyl deacetylase